RRRADGQGVREGGQGRREGRSVVDGLRLVLAGARQEGGGDGGAQARRREDSRQRATQEQPRARREWQEDEGRDVRRSLGALRPRRLQAGRAEADARLRAAPGLSAKAAAQALARPIT